MNFNGNWSRVNAAVGNITASGNNDNSTSITDDNSIAIHNDNSITTTTTTTTSSHPNNTGNNPSYLNPPNRTLNELLTSPSSNLNTTTQHESPSANPNSHTLNGLLSTPNNINRQSHSNAHSLISRSNIRNRNRPTTTPSNSNTLNRILSTSSGSNNINQLSHINSTLNSINSNVHSSISRNIPSLNDLRDIHNSNRNRRNRSTTTTTTTLVPNSNNTQRTRPNSGYQIANNIQSLRRVHRSSPYNNTDFRSSHRRSRRPMNSDDDRSRSRNRNRNRNNTRQNTQTPTPTISIPSFNGLAHGIDKREAENIYRIIHERSSIFCNNILEIIAEFMIGQLYECTNNICEREILIMNSGQTFGGHFQNPQSVIQVNGNIDCNDKLLTFCNSCFVNTRTCELDLKRWSLRNHFNNNNGGMVIFNIHGGVSLSDRVNFNRIFCTKKYMDNGVQYCSDCIYGKQLSIGNYNIFIKCNVSSRVSSQQYSIGAETHIFYDNGGDSHTNIGGRGGTNIHNNINCVNNYW